MMFQRRILILGAMLVGISTVELVFSLSYWPKSLFKILFFVIIPLVLMRDVSFLRLRRAKMILPLCLGCVIFAGIVGGYFIVHPYLDFSNVTTSLQQQYGITPQQFIYVALYIALINSLIEEVFFRGFCFLQLSQTTSLKKANWFSAVAFSLHHIVIMKGWFDPWLFALFLIALLVSGMLFNWLSYRNQSIGASWFVHMMANLAINTVGLILFGLIG